MEMLENLLQTDPENLPQKQLQMVQEWADQSGQRWPGAAKRILNRYLKPMTQERCLRVDGIGMQLDDLLEDEEALAELPEWFQQLPRGDSPGLY
jgi:hypothetical protein